MENTLSLFKVQKGLACGVYGVFDSLLVDVLKKHVNYPPVVQKYLKETVIGALCLAALIPFKGKIKVQFSSSGPISLIVVDMNADLKVRAYAIYDEKKLKPDMPFVSIFEKGHFVFALFPPNQEPYQAIIPIQKNSPAECIMDYLKTSEGVESAFVLDIENNQARAILLTQISSFLGLDPIQKALEWEKLEVLFYSVKHEELFSQSLNPFQVLYRLFHADSLEMGNVKTTGFECLCNKEKMKEMLKSMPNVFENEEFLDIECQYCGQKYTIYKKEIQ